MSSYAAAPTLPVSELNASTTHSGCHNSQTCYCTSSAQESQSQKSGCQRHYENGKVLLLAFIACIRALFIRQQVEKSDGDHANLTERTQPMYA